MTARSTPAAGDGILDGGRDGDRVAALGRQVERIARAQAELDALVRRLAEDIALLAPPPDGDDEEPAGLRSWLSADDPTQAAADLADLAGWVSAVYLRYADAVLPSCWAWHPAVVEELWWLRHAHADAFTGPRACWREVGDWHDRQRPGVARRIRAAVGDCELSRHAPAGDRLQQRPEVPLTAHLDRVAAHWATHADTPEPTEAQLGDAEAYDRTRLRRSTR